MHEGHTPSRFQAILLIVALLCGSLLHGHLHVCIQSHDTTRQLPAGQCRNVLSHADSPQAVTVENAWFCPICAGVVPLAPSRSLYAFTDLIISMASLSVKGAILNVTSFITSTNTPPKPNIIIGPY